MDLKRLNDVLKHIEKNRESVQCTVKDFFQEADIPETASYVKVSAVIENFLKINKYLVLRIPLDDTEIGGVIAWHPGTNVVVINTSVPLANQNFALCHELFHLLEEGNRSHVTADLLNTECYLTQENEYKANQFAGELLLPASYLRTYFRMFMHGKQELTADVVCKLCESFQAPYVSVLIRIAELKLAPLEKIYELLSKADDLINICNSNWIDASFALPTYTNDLDRFYAYVSNKSAEYCRDNLIDPSMAEYALKNIESKSKEIIAE